METERIPVTTGHQNIDPGTVGHPLSLLPAGDLSTCAGVDAFPTYMHGYSVRVMLTLPKADVLLALAKVGFPGTNPKNWAGKVIRTMRGTAWLTGRAPRNPNLPLSKFNKAHGTNLYGVAVQELPNGYALDLSGVRINDIDKVCQTVMEMAPDAYKVAYYRKAEAYVVLAPQEAYQLADALLGVTDGTQGHGRLARKFNLIANHPIPLTVAKRTNVTATLHMYRVSRGATSAFKCEIRLEGKRRDRGTFSQADADRLPQALIDLCRTHGLHPLTKPSRWEPKQADDPFASVPYDQNMQKLPQAAWRGQPVDNSIIANCHTPKGLKLTDSATLGGSYPPGTRIRNEDALSSLSLKEEGTPTTTPSLYDSSTPTLNQGATTSPKVTCWTELAGELLSLKGSLSEVILDGEQDPKDILEALIQGDPDIAISILHAAHDPSWYTARELAEEHPGSDQSKTWDIVVDPSVIGAVQDNAHVYDPETRAFLDGEVEWVDPETGEILPVGSPSFISLPGPCCRHPQELVSGSWRSETRAGAATLTPVLKEWRDLCEREGINIILISVDCRPDHGRGDLQKAHFFRDSRVRSLLGDAGRFYCHQRYLVEPNGAGTTYKADGLPGCNATAFVGNNTVTAIKDEAEGRTGRLVFKPNPWGTSGVGHGRQRF